MDKNNTVETTFVGEEQKVDVVVKERFAWAKKLYRKAKELKNTTGGRIVCELAKDGTLLIVGWKAKSIMSNHFNKTEPANETAALEEPQYVADSYMEDNYTEEVKETEDA